MAGGPVPGRIGETRGGIYRNPAGNRPMLHLNPIATVAVLGSDEHRKVSRDARRCDEQGPVVS